MFETVWPTSVPSPLADRTLGRLARVPGFCNICGTAVRFHNIDPNFREHMHCPTCGSVNRYRQIMRVLLAETGRRGLFASTRALPHGLQVWNTENTRALHSALRAHPGLGYTSSEFINPTLASGTWVNGVLHVDMQKTHFPDDSLDFVLSSDVLEHVPHYPSALREVYRILKPGGAHIFTAPFYGHRASIENRARHDADGQLRHLRKPWYHGDPLRPDGVLCYNVFAIELLAEMERIGYHARLLRLHDPRFGIYGSNGYVFVAKKVTPAPVTVDHIYTEVHDLPQA